MSSNEPSESTRLLSGNTNTTNTNTNTTTSGSGSSGEQSFYFAPRRAKASSIDNGASPGKIDRHREIDMRDRSVIIEYLQIVCNY